MSTAVTIAPIHDDARLHLDLCGRRAEVRLHAVRQRNWSRVAFGEVRDPAPELAQGVFVKQFLDRRGVAQAAQWQYEFDGHQTALAVPLADVEVIPVVARLPDSLVLCYPRKQLITPDALLRRDGASFARLLPRMLTALKGLLAALEKAPAAVPGPLPRKQRGYGGNQPALNFKGLDIRNCAWPCDTQGRPIEGPPLLFDLGRPYLAPIEEAAAKFVVSCGLLNWGTPVRRFVRGPDLGLLHMAATTLRPYVDPAAIAAEIDLQERFRLYEFQARNVLTWWCKRVAIGAYGRPYLRRMRRAAADLPPSERAPA